MDEATCDLCGEPMPIGEEMLKFHGLSGPCPKPPLPKSTEAQLPGKPSVAIGVVVSCPKGHEYTYRPSDQLSGLIYCTSGECWSDGCQGDSGSGTYYNLSQLTLVAAQKGQTPMTLEQYLQSAAAVNVIDHAIRCRIVDGAVTFYIHPSNTPGDTLDFEVNGNTLQPDPRVTKALTRERGNQ